MRITLALALLVACDSPSKSADWTTPTDIPTDGSPTEPTVDTTPVDPDRLRLPGWHHGHRRLRRRWLRADRPLASSLGTPDAGLTVTGFVGDGADDLIVQAEALNGGGEVAVLFGPTMDGSWGDLDFERA